jgi:hypothetical protein
MATEVICPDCGGVINGDPNGPRPVCQCELNLSLDDTEVEAQPVVPAQTGPAPIKPAAPAPSGPRKICCQCGKDVTNAKRAKDARGYWCYECHRNDLRKERAANPRTRCPQCGRLVPAESITTYHGEAMCAKCRIEQDDLPNHMKLKFKHDTKEEKEAAHQKEKKRVIILASVLGVLAIIIILGRLHWLPF